MEAPVLSKKRQQQQQAIDREKQQLDPALEGFLARRRAERSMEGFTKADVGLPYVDNTRDQDKPVSTAQAQAIASAVEALNQTITAALALKAALVHTHAINDIDGLSSALQGLSGATAGKVAKAGDTMTGPLIMPGYLKAALPSASANVRSMIYVSDLNGGAEFCFSDGTTWRRISDRSLVN